MRAFYTFLVALAIALFSAPALAYTPPPIEGPVTDTAHKLTDADKREINDRLRRFKVATRSEITVFVTGTLDGQTIEDVAYDTARAWKLGTRGVDHDVLLVIAPAERKIRIETAKGAGGDLTDLQANQIIRERIAPKLKQDLFRDAIDGGIDGIAAALGGATSTTPRARPTAAPTSNSDVAFGIFILVAVIATPILIFVFVIRSIVRAVKNGPGRGYGGGGYYPPTNNDWGSSGSSGSSDSFGSGSSGDSGGSGGGDWGGGGGDWGGGGSSGDF